MMEEAQHHDPSELMLTISRQHRLLMTRLRALASVDQTSSSEEIVSALRALDSIFNDGIDIYGAAECSVAKVEQRGDLDASHTQRLVVGNFGQTLRMVAEFYSTVQTTARQLGVTDPNAGIPKGDAYAAMQAIVRRFRPEWVHELRQLMFSACVPTVGFDEEPPPVKVDSPVAPQITITQNSGPTVVNVGSSGQIQQGVTPTSTSPSLIRAFLTKLVEAPGAALATAVGSFMVAYLIVHFGLK